MMGIRGSTIIGVALAVWIVWIVLATDHMQRIERTCQPVLWTGNIVTSVTALIAPDYQDNVDGVFQSTDYGCRYTVWRLIYEERWLEEQEEGTSPEDHPVEETR